MKWEKAFLLPPPIALVAALFLGNLGVATAGVEPSPFQPEINQLGAAENILVSANSRIIKAMDHPPDPVVPSPNLNGALNRLDAINRQLVSVDDMVASMIEEVMGFEPSPFHPLSEIVPAIAGVQGAALNIVEEIDARLGFEPTPFVPEFEAKLLSVQSSAQGIETNTQNYINQIDCDPNACMGIDSRTECESIVCCVWISTDNNEDPDFGYCDIDTDYQPEL
ncbi:MAG: hypothetical protein KJO01_07185 [Gammaproteobacteria bacterium]|nr:hypothetical protein [Gammaproteobacteria bacterium]MBT8111908.1 hypothetical protein [Gammaproteobacteria bacterium]NND47927.1 hypothetical protein [Woeseiaceae bacterium]NNL46607.1 hypothetical protein [Woeseiaceae bacterium]